MPVTAALLPLLEPATSGNWSCPYFEVRFDMSWVIWVLTSNDWRGLPEPLLSRCPPIGLPEITRADLVAFARRVGARRGLSEASIEAIVEALEHPANRTRRLSLRSVIRMLDRAKDMEGDPPPS
jgi:ATP-dependent Lon protease